MTQIDEQRLSSIRKNISLLEWDLSIIKNEDLAIKKRAHLEQLRAELKTLMGQSDNRDVTTNG